MFELDFILCKSLIKFRPHCVQQVVCGLGAVLCVVDPATCWKMTKLDQTSLFCSNGLTGV